MEMMSTFSKMGNMRTNPLIFSGEERNEQMIGPRRLFVNREPHRTPSDRATNENHARANGQILLVGDFGEHRSTDGHDAVEQSVQEAVDGGQPEVV